MVIIGYSFIDPSIKPSTLRGTNFYKNLGKVPKGFLVLNTCAHKTRVSWFPFPHGPELKVHAWNFEKLFYIQNACIDLLPLPLLQGQQQIDHSPPVTTCRLLLTVKFIMWKKEASDVYRSSCNGRRWLHWRWDWASSLGEYYCSALPPPCLPPDQKHPATPGKKGCHYGD